MKIFEIQVTDKRTSNIEYIIFDIQLQKNTLIAKHEALSLKQSNSKKIAFVKHVLDSDFSIDSNLIELYDNCIQAIIDSEYFELAD